MSLDAAIPLIALAGIPLSLLLGAREGILPFDGVPTLRNQFPASRSNALISLSAACTQTSAIASLLELQLLALALGPTGDAQQALFAHGGDKWLAGDPLASLQAVRSLFPRDGASRCSGVESRANPLASQSSQTASSPRGCRTRERRFHPR